MPLWLVLVEGRPWRDSEDNFVLTESDAHTLAESLLSSGRESIQVVRVVELPWADIFGDYYEEDSIDLIS